MSRESALKAWVTRRREIVSEITSEIERGEELATRDILSELKKSFDSFKARKLEEKKEVPLPRRIIR
jgi:hypothetical protein